MSTYGIPVALHLGISTILLVALSSCAGTANTSADSSVPGKPVVHSSTPPDFALALPAPTCLFAQTAVNRRASFVEDDVAKNGKDFLAQSHNRVVAGAVEATFTPQWQAGDPFNDVAYCVYHFNADGYDRMPTVRLFFQGEVPALSNTWIALADWTKDRWEWQDVSILNGNEIRYNAGDFAPHFNAGWDFFIVVALTGNGSYGLTSLRLGPFTPNVKIKATPTFGSTPLAVNFDASNSGGTDYPIAKFEWDLDGDGVFEKDTGTTGTTANTYSSGGTVHAGVRVTDTQGTWRTEFVDIYPVDSWQRTWGLSYYDDLTSVVADSDGFIYTLGTIFDTSIGDADILLAKWTPTGDLIYAKKYDSGHNDYATQLVIDESGRFSAIGTVDNNGTRNVLFIQWWDSDGAFESASYAGGDGDERGCKLVVNYPDYFIAGSTSSLTSGFDVFLLKLSYTGAITWQTACDASASDVLSDLSPLSAATGVTSGVAAIFDYDDTITHSVCKLEYDLDGNLSSSKQLGNIFNDIWDSRLICTYNPLTLSENYYVGGMITVSNIDYAFLSKTDGTGANIYCSLQTPIDTANITSMALDPTGRVFLCGYGKTNNSLNDALLYVFHPFTGAAIASCCWRQDDQATRFNSVVPYLGGGLMAGSSKDAQQSWWETMPVSGPAMTLDFTDISVAKPAIAWSFEELPFTETDITSDVVLDTGAGNDDGLLMYRPDFGF